MKALLKELEGEDEEEFQGETEAMGEEIDLSKLTPEEEKREEEWAKKMVEAYRTGLRDALERKGRVGTSAKDMKTTTHAISFSQVLKDLKNDDLTHTASFPLIHTGRMIRMRALSGDEIPDLDYQNYASDMEASRAMYNLLYRHDVSANKPATFNEWLRSICDWDIFNIYMALYIATFRDSNFIPYNCPECQNMFFEERDIKEMYRKHPDASDDFEERVKKIEELGDSSFNSSTKPVYTPISSRFGLDLHAPSIYSATFETASLEPSFIEKHRQAVNLIQYIGDVYMVKPGFDGKPERSKINFKIDRDNETKTVKLKIIAVEKIISSLSTDEAGDYIFLVDNQGRILSCGANQEYIGKNIDELVDSDGKNSSIELFLSNELSMENFQTFYKRLHSCPELSGAHKRVFPLNADGGNAHLFGQNVDAEHPLVAPIFTELHLLIEHAVCVIVLYQLADVFLAAVDLLGVHVARALSGLNVMPCDRL